MPQVRFQVSTSDQFGAPGVYVDVVAVQGPVGGVFLGTTGIIGACVKGPVNVLVQCNSYARFLDVFGARDYGVNGGAIVGDVWWALQWKRIGVFYVCRAAAAAAAVASFEVNTAAAHAGTNVVNIAASSPGAWGNNVKYSVQAASDGVSTHWNLSIKDLNSGKQYLYPNLNTSGGANNLNQVIGSDYAVPIVCTLLAAGRPVNNTPSTDGADANGYVFLGQTVAGYISVTGSDGAIANSDYTAVAIPLLNAARGIDSKLVANRSNSTIKTAIFAVAPTANLSDWLICPDTAAVTDTTWETEISGYRDRHIFPVYNHPNYVDPVTGVLTTGEPHVTLACDLSQIQPDTHPGVADVAPLHTAIQSLSFILTDAQRDALDLAGSTFINQDQDTSGNNVWLWGNGRTADLSVNNSQIDGERSKNYLIQGIANRMRGDQDRPNTKLARTKRAAAIGAWLKELAKSGRFVDSQVSPDGDFTIQNGDSVNTASDRAAGIQRDVVNIALIPKNLYLQLQIAAGTQVVITDTSSNPVNVNT